MLIDTDGDGSPDIAYAGDLLGHVWKFDISAEKPAKWHVALNGQPLFTALGPDGTHQAITTAPIWLPHPKGGVMLGIGTGRALTTEDRADASPQTLYGLHDSSARGKSLPINSPDDAQRPAELQARAILPQALEHAGRSYFRSAAAAQQPEYPRGWYLDLPARGERLLHTPQHLAGQKAIFPSSAPEGEFLTVLDLLTGEPSGGSVFTTVSDPARPEPEGAPDRTVSRVALGSSRITALHRLDSLVLRSDDGRPPLVLQKRRGAGLRAGWRQRP
ncbi:hypothetical protein GT347_00620 [Xylophilus rhododendri]|uniref:PilY1 beta-propeller domain-containing protein n=1 Tax=Xylophilus rhododendri TaxID=2697032 RepID=A0A857J0J6_9BURK|nr:PilC/PilY family type IV pilus protein [Xylophilus rhododendri]QHI96631.1 hypothetical protein GT347_00620 [Xylophilus rhododendri]